MDLEAKLVAENDLKKWMLKDLNKEFSEFNLIAV